MNNVYNCLITHLEIVGRLIKVWVQHNTKNAKEIEEAIASIKNSLDYAEAPTSIEQFSQRGVYFAKYADNEFYRCTVLGRCSASASKVNVAFIDYGNTQAINLSDIRMITNDFKNQLPVLSLPGQATYYYLYAVAIKPGAMTERDLDWLKSITLNCEFQCYMHEGIYGIRMISILMEHNIELSNLLVQKNVGQMVSREELCTMAKELMQYSAGVTSYPVTAASQPRFPVVAQPVSKIEVIPALNPGVRKPSMPIYQPPPVYQHMISQQQVSNTLPQQQRFVVSKEKMLNLSPFPTQQQTVKKVLDNTITVGSAYQMYVSHVEDGPLQFSLQLRQYADEVLPFLSSQMTKLGLQNFTSALTIGTIVIGMHQPDKTLRRAMIISSGSNTCKVYYVDVGSSESLQFSNIFQLPTSLNTLNIPAVAINFALKGMDASQVTASIKAGFQELVMSKVVLAKVMTEGPMRTCDLFVDGRDVKTLLSNFNQPLQYLRQFPPREKETTVVVSYVEGPHQVFVQYKSETAILAAVEETLASYWTHQKEITNINDLTIGKPVLSLYSSDNQWYRAQIMEISPNQTITVLYVDYGNKEYVNATTLREISSELVSKWRCQAVECCLVGFDSILPSDALAEKLEEKILSCEVTLRLHSLISADRLLVDLIDSSGNSIAAYMTELHNNRIANAQSVTTSPNAASSYISRESSVQSFNSVDNKSEKEYDFNDKKAGKKDDTSQKWKQKESYDNVSSNSKWKSKDQDDSTHANKWKSKDQDDSSHANKWKSKDQDDSYANKWKSKDQDDSSHANKWKSKDQDDSSHGRKWKMRDQDDSPPSNKWKPRENDDHRPNKWKNKDEESSSSDKWKSKDHDDRWKKDSDDSLSNKWKSKDSYDRRGGENDGFNKKFQNRDEGKFPSRDDKWKNSRSDRDDSRGSKWNKEDRFQVDSKKDWKSKDSDFKSKDSDYRSKDSNYRSKDTDYRSKDTDYRSKDSDYRSKDSDYRSKDSGSRKWEDDGRKGRGEFKWKDSKFSEDYNSKKTSKTLYSDSPEKSSSHSSTRDEEPPVSSDVRFNPKVKEYVGWDLQNRTTSIVTLAHIDSPERFFVRPIEADAELDNLRDMIDSDTNITSRVLPPKAVVVGTPVLALYSEDEQLYRAVIEKVNSKTVEVLFVDYGNSSEIPSNELYYPADNLACLPMTVIRCNLSNVKPSGGSWSTDTDELTKCFGGEAQLNMTMESVKLVDGLAVHNVSLTLVDSGKSIAQCLVDAGLAKSTSSKGSSPSLQTQESVEPISALPLPLAEESTAAEDEWVEHVELLVGQFLLSKVVSIISTETIVVKLDATNLLIVCVSPDTSSVQIGDTVIIHVNCFLEDRIRVTIYDKGGYVAGDIKKELPQVSPVCQMPLTRSRFRVQVPHCESPFVYVQKVSDADRIAEMLDSLYTFYEETKPSGKEFSVNSLCAVKSSDENWYRARIIKRDGDIYKIRFIDYGNTEDVTASQIRKLDAQFYFPELAFKAQIHLKWKIPEHEVDLMKYVEGKEWNASFLKHNIEDWYISLQSDDGKKLFDELIQQGLADNYKENPFYEVNSVIGNDIVAGDKIPVTVTHVESPELFWVQMVKHVQTVQTLQDKLQDFTETKKDSNCAVFAAKYSADELWYRALSIDTNNPDLVRFIDYGNTDTVTEKKDLSHTLTKPRSGYAVKMCLCAVPKGGGEWSQEALDMFETFIDANEVNAEIVSVSYKIITDLTVDGKSISKMLIEKGYAEYEDFTPIIIKNYLSIKECQVSTVFICHTVSVNDFYTLDRNREPELEEFTSQFLDYDTFPPVKSTAIGSLVMAKFPDDESWYRAKITELDPLTVLFIDFGNSSVVDEIGELPSEFVDMPAFAVHCSLDLEESDLALDKFLEITDEGKNVFNMSVLRKGSPNIVKLTLNDTDICSLLPKVQNTVVNIDGQVGFVSHFNSFTEFYIQLKDDSKLDNVIDELCAAETFGDVDKMSIGSLVAALFPEDGSWYRAKITLLDPLTVLFYDYGNMTEVYQVKELPPDLKLIPALAYRCSYEKPSCIKEWTETVIDAFLELSQDGLTPFNIRLVKGGNPNIVTLLNENNQEVISSIAGQGDDNKVSGDGITSSHVSDVTSAIGNMDLSDNKVSNSGDKITQALPRINNKYVTISHFESVDDFHVVCDEDSSLLETIVKTLSDVSSLENNYDTSVDLVVAALCSETEEWKRSKILSVEPTKVQFIDSGMICEVQTTKILPGHIGVSVIKPLAIHCSLRKPKNYEHWPQNVTLLEEYMALSTDKLKIRVHSKCDIFVVSLFLNDKDIISKMGEMYVLSPPTFDFQTPSLYNNKIVFISYADSINSFYVQKEADSAKLGEVSETLLHSDDFDSVENLDVGDIVSAKFPDDGVWYRALVLTVQPDITVKFLDYGNSSVVKEVKDLPEDLKELPPLSLHCNLDLPRGLQSWTSEAEEKFMEISGNSETPYVLRAVSPGNPCSINLLKSDKEELSKILAGDAIPTDLVEPEPVNNLIKPNPKKSVYRDFADFSDSESDMMNNKLAILSHINSLDEFFVQLLDDADKITEIIEKLMDGDNFEDVKDDSEGVMIAAQFSDMQWHRAKILKKKDEGYEVSFIDYGNTSDVTNIKELPVELKEIPSLAYKLSLKKPEGVPEWTEEMEKQFALFKELNSLPVVILTQPSGCVSLMVNDVNIYNKFTTLSLEGFGENMVFITYCESPASFYVQYNTSFDSQQTVLDLLKEAETFKDSGNVEEGDLVCAKHPDDENWYRCKVLKTSPDLCVLFIDFGSTAVVTDTKELSEELKAIEPLAKHCCLNPPRCGSGWTPEACSYFLALSTSPFTVNIIEEQESGPTTVDIFIEGNSVTSDLLELCPGVERLPESNDLFDDMDIDDEDVMREEALFNAEESIRRNQNDNGNNNSGIICNGISDLSIDEKDETVLIENSRNIENSNLNRDLRIDDNQSPAREDTTSTSDQENKEEPPSDNVEDKTETAASATDCDTKPETLSDVNNTAETLSDINNKAETLSEENNVAETLSDVNTKPETTESENVPSDNIISSDNLSVQEDSNNTDKDEAKTESSDDNKLEIKTEEKSETSETPTESVSTNIPKSDSKELDDKSIPSSKGDVPSEEASTKSDAPPEEPQVSKIQTEDKLLPGAVQGNLSLDEA